MKKIKQAIVFLLLATTMTFASVNTSHNHIDYADMSTATLEKKLKS